MNRLKYVFLAMCVWFAVHEVVIIVDGLNDEVIKSDYAVIFGTKVNEAGNLSVRLRARVDRGLELYNNKVVSKIFVSGGFGKEGFYEGSKMAEYLISMGVPESDVFVDNEGNNTMLTAKNFVQQNGDSVSVIVVSQFFHISRAKLAFSKMKVKQVRGTHCEHFEIRDFYSLFRELFGWYKYLILY